jgi:hypothetical protein
MEPLEARGAEVFYCFGHADCTLTECSVRVAASPIHYALAILDVEG